MLNKNKLLNLLLKFEMAFNDSQQAIDKKTNELGQSGDFHAASLHSYIIEIIERNIQSIKKQIDNI
jgi:hypothetical protein